MTTGERRGTGSDVAGASEAVQGSDAPASIPKAGNEDLKKKLMIMRQRCEQVEAENKRLKLLVAELMLRNEALKHVVAKDA
jgi:hypothetical protein